MYDSSSNMIIYKLHPSTLLVSRETYPGIDVAVQVALLKIQSIMPNVSRDTSTNPYNSTIEELYSYRITSISLAVSRETTHY